MAARATTTKAENGRAAAAATPTVGFVIPRVQLEVSDIPIVGTTSLITHPWSEKAVKQMLDSQMKRAKGPKEAKNPEQDYEASKYVADPDGWLGVPSCAFKAAMVGACRAVDGLPMTVAKRMLFVLPDGRTKDGTELTRIEGEPRMRRDLVRLESGTADIRFRAEFVEWSAVIRVEYNAGLISAEMVLNLVELAGRSEGICEWRPSAPKSCTGSHGLFRVVRD